MTVVRCEENHYWVCQPLRNAVHSLPHSVFRVQRNKGRPWLWDKAQVGAVAYLN